MEAQLADLQAEVKRLHNKLQKVEGMRGTHGVWNITHTILDEAEIRKTHFKYGYYIDKCLYSEARFTGPVS